MKAINYFKLCLVYILNKIKIFNNISIAYLYIIKNLILLGLT